MYHIEALVEVPFGDFTLCVTSKLVRFSFAKTLFFDVPLLLQCPKTLLLSGAAKSLNRQIKPKVLFVFVKFYFVYSEAVEWKRIVLCDSDVMLK